MTIEGVSSIIKNTDNPIPKSVYTIKSPLNENDKRNVFIFLIFLRIVVTN